MVVIQITTMLIPRTIIPALLLLGVAGVAEAQTTVPGGNLVGSPTWTAAGSPYRISGDLTVPAGSTLTIQAGVTIEVATGDTQGSGTDSARTELIVNGTLNVQGTSANPVVMQPRTGTANSSYYGVRLESGSSISASYFDIRYAHRALTSAAASATISNLSTTNAGYGVWVTSGSLTLTGANILNSTSYGAYISGGSSLTFTNGRVEGSSSYGLYASNGNLTITGSTIIDNNRGIYFRTSSGSYTLNARHNTIEGNTSSGIYVYRSSGTNQATIQNNVIVSNGTYGIYRSGSASVTATYNLVYGHNTNYSSVTAGTGSLSEDPLLVNAAMGDYRPTSRSGARGTASDGSDMGAHTYAGTPTPTLVGHQRSNLTLTRAASPHLITGDFIVEPGVTLTIEAGAELRFARTDDALDAGADRSRAELIVRGILMAVGTETQKIRFVSSGTSPARNDWYGIILTAGTTASRIDHAVISHARYGLTSQAPSGNTLSNTEIAQSGSYGLYVTSGALTASSMNIHDNASYGIYGNNGSLTISDSMILDNGSRGIYMRSSSGSHSLSASHNTINGHTSSGIYVYRSSGTMTAVIRSNLVFGNGSYGIYRSGSASVTASHNLVWNHSNNYSSVTAGAGSLSENPLVVNASMDDFRPTSRSGLRNAAHDNTDIGARPYDGVVTPQLVGHLHANTILTRAASPHVVAGDLIVENGVTLTIEPGAELRFTPRDDLLESGLDTSRCEITVRGTLVADGTASLGIRFVSAGTSPARSDWYGIHFTGSTAASIVDYATITHARYAIHSQAPVGTTVQRSEIANSGSYGAYITSGNITLSQLDLHDNASYGIYVNNGSATIDRSQIYDNGSRGIYARASSGSHSVTASDNTIVGHTSSGIYAYRSSGSLTFVARNNIVVNNGTYGIYRSGSASVTATHNLVWGQSTNYSSVTAGASITENPLFVNEAMRDLRITSNSPARLHASNGGDIGALDYDGTPTIGVQGHLYSDTIWTNVAGPINVLGDITIEPGVTLTIEPGTIVQMASQADSMGGGSRATHTELRANGRLLVRGTAASKVTIRSAAASPAAGNWDGIYLPSSSANTSIQHAIIEHGRYGINSLAPATTNVSQTEIRNNSSYGVYITTGAIGLDGLYIHDNNTYGIYSTNASPDIHNSVIANNGSRGIYLRGSSGSHSVDINHVTVYGHTSSGIYVYRSSGSLTTDIRNSVVASNGTYGVYRSGSASVRLGRNNVWGHNTNYSSVTAGGGSLSAAPQFVNIALGNYHLLPTSTNIDAADTATALNHDAEGTVRPLDGDGNGSALPDLGAFEYNPSANRWPIADAGTNRVVTSGTLVSFSAAGSVDPDGTIVSYAWNFGDGSTANGLNVTHTFMGGTDRTVTLTVTDNAGATDVDTIQVEVNLPPTANAGPMRYADPGEIVTFSGSASTDSDGNIVNYSWDFGDGTTASGVSVTHQYTGGGNYTVTLTVTDDDGATGQATTVANITGNDTQPPSISHTVPASGNQGQALTISADVTDSSGVGSVVLYFRLMGAATFSALPMTAPMGSSTYTAQIPGAQVNAGVLEYYIQARDQAGTPNTGTHPPTAPTTLNSVTIQGPTNPTITHTPIANGQPSGTAVPVMAQVSAPNGIGTVNIFYRTMGTSSFTQAAMMAGMGGNYSFSLPAAAVVAPAVEYYIEVTDMGMPAQTVSSPMGMGMVHTFTVVAQDQAAPTITHTPIINGQPENQAVMISAQVTDPSGVANVQLYYRASGAATFTTSAMMLSGGNYVGQIPAGSVTRSGVDYYIQARDSANPANTGTEPANAPTTYLSFSVQRVFNIMEGDIVVSEIMANPSGSETQREWFELYNTTQNPIDIDGFIFSDDGTDSFTVANGGPLTIASGGYLVLGRNSDTAVNGGVTVDYVYSGFALANTADEIEIRAGTILVDRVAYDTANGFPNNNGRSMTLDPNTLDDTSNNDAANWCESMTALSGGDLGTPGADNDGCQAPVDMTAPVIVHTPISDGQQQGVAVAVTANVTDDRAVDAVQLFYRPAGMGSFSSANMMNIGGDTFQAEIPGRVVNLRGVEYYLTARDPTGNEALAPMNGAMNPHSFMVTSNDTSGPVITHVPVTDGQPVGMAVKISATITDPSGIMTVTLNYQPDGGSWTQLNMTETSMGLYEADIPANEITPAGVSYYIEATDTITPPNASTAPMAGMAMPYSFTGKVVDTSGPVIVHTPVTDGQTPNSPVMITAEVTDASGVAEVRVYFRSAGEANYLSAALTGQNDTYQGEIPAAVVTGSAIEYYLEAVDNSDEQNLSRDPESAPQQAHRFTLGSVEEDTEAPTILHIQVSDGQKAGKKVEIVAEVVDNTGIQEVTVYYRNRNNPGFSKLDLNQETGSNRYLIDLPAAEIIQGTIEYYLVAIDSSAQKNQALRPANAPNDLYSFTVVENTNPRDSGGGCVCVEHDKDNGVALPALLAFLLPLLILRRRRR